MVKVVLAVDRGSLNLELKHYSEVDADFVKAIELNPNYHAPHSDRARIKFLQADYDGAFVEANKAVELIENGELCWCGYIERGAIYEIRGEILKACDDYQRALAQNPFDERVPHMQQFVSENCNQSDEPASL